MIFLKTDAVTKSSPKPCLITMRMAGHAGPSGYDRLAEFIPGHVIHPVNDPSPVQRILGRSFRFMIRRSGSLWYHRESFLSELQAAAIWYRSRGKVFHFLYGENCYRYLGKLKSKSRRNAIVCTYHTPPNKFCTVVGHRSHLGELDGVVVVSKAQVAFFSDILGDDRVFYIPHGIDVEYFKPSDGKGDAQERIELLFVGTHLRDFKTLAEVARQLNANRVAFSLKVVTASENHHFFRGIDNLELYFRIPDVQLLNLYREAHILIMPLLDCTANNSLLEGMACGLPIVCTDLPGARDYAGSECTIFTAPEDPSAIAAAVVRLQADKNLRQKMALASRLCALEFSWEKVACKTREVYRRLAGREEFKE